MAKKIAIIGSGIGAIAAAYDLKKKGYKVSLFEKNDYFGGHTHTHNFNLNNHHYTVDTGFLVHNDRTYPHLINFFQELDLKSHPSEMSFSVRVENEDLEWSGTNLATLFCQPKNLIKPRFYRFLKEIMRFNKESNLYIEEARQDLELSLGALLDKYSYSENFRHWYLLPMGGCIWSSPTDEMLKFPAYTFLHFCQNHGLLQIFDRPQWKTLIGGCHQYTKAVIGMLDNTYKSEGVLQVKSLGKKVEVITEKRSEHFDAVVFGTHAPDTIGLIQKIDPSIESVLKSFRYQRNKAVLHTDESLLPKKKMAWSSWNYRSYSSADRTRAVSVSYLINKLQPLPKETPIIVTLNPFQAPKEDKVIKEMTYYHPLFDAKAVTSQALVPGIQGKGGLFFSGAWMRYGFHEDGIWAAKQAVAAIDLYFENQKELEVERHAVL